MGKNDNSLIYMISENSRYKLQDISRFLKKSSPRLKYNIKMLEKDEVLKEHYAVFDYSYFGLLLFRVYFKGGYIGETDKKRILNILMKNSHIIGIYELSGEYDLVLEIAAPNPSRFNKELKELVSIKQTMNNYKIILNYVSYIYPRHYLTKSQILQSLHKERIIGGDRINQDFSENEMAVIKELVKNPNGRLSTMAKNSNMNILTLKKTIESLTNKNILQGFKRFVNIEKLGISKHRLFLKLHNMSKEADQEITEHLLQTKEVIILNKTVGDWDMEIDIETFDKTIARKIIMEIRSKFTDIIESFNMIEFDSYYKRSYLPEFIFDESK